MSNPLRLVPVPATFLLLLAGCGRQTPLPEKPNNAEAPAKQTEARSKPTDATQAVAQAAFTDSTSAGPLLPATAVTASVTPPPLPPPSLPAGPLAMLPPLLPAPEPTLTTAPPPLLPSAPAASTAPQGQARANLAKLRRLADLPQVRCEFGFEQRGGAHDGHGNLIEPAKEIDKRLPRLNGSADDAEIYLELAGFHYDLKQLDKGLEMAQKAETLLRPFVNTTDPKDAARLTNYVVAYSQLHPTEWKEPGVWARRATELDPKNWMCWQMLGNWFHNCAETTVLGRLPEKGEKYEALERLLNGKVPLTVVAEVDKHLQEARRCYDRAKELAPTSEKQWNARIAFRLGEFSWINAMRVARGGSPLPSALAAPEFAAKGFNGGFAPDAFPEHLQDMREGAERCPDDLGLQCYGLMALVGQLKGRCDPGAVLQKKGRPTLTVEEARFFDETAARIEKIAQQGTPEASRYCLQMLGTLSISLAMFADFPPSRLKGESCLKRIVEADPMNQNAAEAYEGILVAQEHREHEALQVAKRRLANMPSTRNRYLVAKALDLCGQTEAALTEMTEAVKLDPADPYCLAGQAALLIRAAGKQDVLVQASQLLQRARYALKPDMPASLYEDIDFLIALQLATMGQDLFARLQLENLRSRDPQARRYGAALEVLGPLDATAR